MRLSTVYPALLAACLLLSAPTPVGAQPFPEIGGTSTYAAIESEVNVTIPDDPALGALRLVVKGGAGGEGETTHCYNPGGRGALIGGTFRVGTDEGELRAGAKLRFLVGSRGGSETSIPGITWPPPFHVDAAGGGGGGSGVLYSEDGGLEWFPLLVAGGGGGAHQAQEFGFCAEDGGGPGQDAQLGENGGDAGSPGGTNGFGGPVQAGEYGGSGGGLYGPGAADSESSEGGGAGFPSGGDGGAGQGDGASGGWGCGGGGRAVAVWAGGGGGYSGGGSGQYGGGGGGSYVSPWAEAVSKTHDGSQPDGFARLSAFSTQNYDTCEDAEWIPFIDGGETLTLPDTTNGYLGSPGISDGACPATSQTPDRWYRYENTSFCPRTITLTGGPSGEPHRVALYSDCDFANSEPFACADLGSVPLGPLPIFGGETVFIRVYSATGNGSGYSLQVTVDLVDGTDADGDLIPDCEDNCPEFNPTQGDADFDLVGDLCDVCPGSDDTLDEDGDGVPDGCDTCPGFDDLADQDGDGLPDGCDPVIGNDFADADGDGVPDAVDLCPGPSAEDCNANGIPDGCDLGALARFEDFGLDGDDLPYRLQSSAPDATSFLWGHVMLTDGTPNQSSSLNFEPVSETPLTDFEAEFWVRRRAVNDLFGSTDPSGFAFTVFDAAQYPTDQLYGETGLDAGALTIGFLPAGVSGTSLVLVTAWMDGVVIADSLSTFNLKNGAWRKVFVRFVDGALTVTVESLSGVLWPVFSDFPVPGFTPKVARYGFGASSAEPLQNECLVDQILFRDLTPGAVGDTNGDGYIDACQGQWIDQGGALGGTLGSPSLIGSGPLTGGAPFTLSITAAAPGASSTLVLGIALLQAPFKGGILVPTPDILVPGLPIDAGGTLDLPLALPEDVPSGLALHFQVWIPDPAAPVGLAATNGLTAVAF